MKRLWPFFINRKVRAWVEDHVISGTVERILIATNAPVATLKTISPPIPDDGLAIEISGNGAEIIPVHGLPAIKDADVKVRITGRTATVSIGRGNIELTQGRKLAISSGTFEVPDHYPNAPPARVRFRLDGPVSAAAELLNLPRLREFAGSPIDATTSRGTMVAYVALGNAAARGLAAGVGAIRNQSRHLELLRRTAGHGAEGRGADAARARRQQRLCDQGRRQGQRHSRPCSTIARRERSPKRRCALATTLDESGRAKLGFDLERVRRSGRCRSRSTAGCRSTAATAVTRSRPT